jgi:hypothetical protein
MKDITASFNVLQTLPDGIALLIKIIILSFGIKG